MTDTPQEHVEETQPSSAAAKGMRRTASQYLYWLPAIAIACAAVVAVVGIRSHRNEVLAAVEAMDGERAYYDVKRSNVAVNGPRGTGEWRARYAQALLRVLDENDFSDACAYNGFLKEGPSANTRPCIAVGDVRAVRAPDGSVDYFREEARLRRVAALDVMQQDVHASDYVDIDGLSSALDERARRIVREVEDGKRAKEKAEFESYLENSRRLIAESRRIVAETERVLGRGSRAKEHAPDPETGDGLWQADPDRR